MKRNFITFCRWILLHRDTRQALRRELFRLLWFVGAYIGGIVIRRWWSARHLTSLEVFHRRISRSFLAPRCAPDYRGRLS